VKNKSSDKLKRRLNEKKTEWKIKKIRKTNNNLFKIIVTKIYWEYLQIKFNKTNGINTYRTKANWFILSILFCINQIKKNKIKRSLGYNFDIKKSKQNKGMIINADWGINNKHAQTKVHLIRYVNLRKSNIS